MQLNSDVSIADLKIEVTAWIHAYLHSQGLQLLLTHYANFFFLQFIWIFIVEHQNFTVQEEAFLQLRKITLMLILKQKYDERNSNYIICYASKA